MYSPPEKGPDSPGEADTPQIKPTDLRGILRYVPMFRGQTFVIAVDGSIIAHENFSNVLLDIAVLRSLNIRIVLVHGIGRQIKALSSSKGIPITEAYGSGPTDPPTLALAMEACGEVGGHLMAQLSQLGITAVIGNALRATPVGVLSGKDMRLTGKIDRLDRVFFEHQLDNEVVPIVQPVAYTREGQALRINSDLIASQLALALKASKIIFLTPHSGLSIKGEKILNLPVGDLQKVLREDAEAIPEVLRSKASHAVQTLVSGVPRAHILDGRVFGALLIEIFDKVGLGTMIHSNEYQQIRPARKKDVQAIHTIIRNAAREETLRYRTRQAIDEAIADFFVYEIDGSIIGCACLSKDPSGKVIELNSVYVQTFYQGRGVGRKLINFAVMESKKLGAEKLIALSTQSFAYFQQICGFREGQVSELPSERQAAYHQEARNSRILVHDLQ